MKTTAKCKVDSVVVGEIQMVRIGTPVPLTAKFALKSDASGISFGAGTMSTWSKTTLDKLSELLESMENDILAALFEVESMPANTNKVDEDKVPEL